MNFIGNSAQYGGAIYVDDATNFGMCASDSYSMTKSSKFDSECFISVSSCYIRLKVVLISILKFFIVL